MADNAFFELTDGTKIPCQVNPEEITVTLRNSWDSKPIAGRGVPIARFLGSEGSALDPGDVYFDTSEKGDPVTTHTDKLVALMDLEESSDDNVGRPPAVAFHWGDFHSFLCVVEQLELTFMQFVQTRPLRARANMRLRQYEPSGIWNKQNPTSGTPRPHRLHRVQPGESLDRIAATVYGDSGRWRAIADANGIEDPLALRSGTLLALPELDR